MGKSMALTKIIEEEPSAPFITSEATTYIKEMLAKSYPNQVVTKVTLHSGLYYVYTEQD